MDQTTKLKMKNNTQKIQCNIKKHTSQITPIPTPK